MTDLTTDLLQPQTLLLLSFTAASLALRPRGSSTEARLLLAGQLLALGNATVMTELGQVQLTACSTVIGALVSGYALYRRDAALHPWLRFTPAARSALVPVGSGRT